MTTKQFAGKFTDEERAEYKRQQREEAQQRLETAVESLQTSDGFRAWLDARARFHSYSFNNTLLIWTQLPEATRVAAASVWKQLGRYPAKGSKALKVYAPIEWWIKCDADEVGARFNAKKKCHERKIRGFKLVPVFDVSQTAGDELPTPPMPTALDGDSHGHLEPALVALAKEIGFTVATETLPADMGGYCEPGAKRIVIGDGQAPNARIRVLVHEIAHALGIGYAEFGRDAAEVMVEAATYVVLAGQGFDLDAASVPYIAGWGQGSATEKMRTFAETIDRVARRIETAIGGEA
jgi:hypothetical protein